MIRLDISTAASLYLLFSVVGLLIIWVFLGYKGKFKRSSFQRQDIWQCPICTYIYVDSGHEAMSICPRCKSYNKRADGDRRPTPAVRPNKSKGN